MKTYKETFIEELEVSDLDMEPPFYEEGADDPNDYQYMNRGVHSESPPIEIDRLFRLLQKLKAYGANYVYLSDHCDHRGYEFTGVKIEEVS